MTLVILTASLSACSPSPSLTRNLPADFDVAHKVFDQRIKARYPAGSSAAMLVRELSSEGFRPIDVPGPAPITHWYLFNRDRFPCTDVWYVTWTADVTNRITKSAGIYGTACL